MRRVAIIGVGCTAIGEHWDKSLRQLLVEAALRAMDSADVERIDALYVGNMMSGALQEQEHLGALVASHLGLRGIPACKVEAACASGGMAIHQAFLAVASGMYDYVMAIGGEKMTDRKTPEVTLALAMADDREYTIAVGASFVALNALVYRLYIEKFNVDQEDIALFSVHDHKYSVNNPHAQFKKPLTLEAIMNSPPVADPIRLFECAPIGDGAAAVILAPLDKVKDKENAVEILASTAAIDHLSLNEREDILTLWSTVEASRKAYKIARIEPKDIDLVEVHDAFSILGVLSLEDLGFAEKGKGWQLVKEGQIEKDGDIPTNTMGGLLGRGHPVGGTGVYQVVEAYYQLTGRAGANQVDDAELALTQSLGGVAGTSVIHILKRMR